MKYHGISKYEIDKFTKQSWKRNVKIAVRNSAEKNLQSQMKHLKKIDHQKKLNENYELQEYLKTFNLKRARMRFSLESQMVRYFKFNYMSDKNFERKNWSCDFCETGEKI